MEAPVRPSPTITHFHAMSCESFSFDRCKVKSAELKEKLPERERPELIT